MIDYLQQSALQQLSAQLLSAQLPFSQHFESASQQAVVHTQLDESQRQFEVYFELMAYIVPATSNNNTVDRMTRFLFIFLLYCFVFPVAAGKGL